MGRAYIVEEAVEAYLSKLCEKGSHPVTGLLIGQNSAQRDFVIMATRTPEREEISPASGNFLDKDWVAEHARQVSRMLPAGLSVIGVFIITDADAKDTLMRLQHLVFAVQNLISSEYLWKTTHDDITDCVTLQINPKTKKTVCRSFDIKDPKSTAKPADWKYQSGVCSSWSTVSCCLNVDLLVPIPDSRSSTESMTRHIEEGLKLWARQIESAVCLLDGKKLPEDAELAAGQRRNVGQAHTAQLLITPEKKTTAVVQQCGGSISVRGAVHSTAHIHSNKPRARLAEKLLKRDVVSTVATRVKMLLEELQISEEESGGGGKKQTERLSLPSRVYCPVKVSGPVCVCDYHFSDESLSEVTDRLKEMLDIDASEEDLDTTQESPVEVTEKEVATEPAVETREELTPKRNDYLGIAVAGAVALLASAASLLYLNDV